MNKNINYPLSDLNAHEIKINIDKDYVKSYDSYSDSLYLANVLSYLDTIKSSSLIRGERIHNADYKGRIELISPENNNIVIIFNEHKDNGVIASFLINRKDNNFQEFLGDLYNADSLFKLMIKKNVNN